MALAERRTFFDSVTYNWPAILAGVVAALVVQILLTMLGIGAGMLALDPPTASSAPLGVGWLAFLWWAISGIIAAFIGGWVAGAASMPGSGAANALAAWALATIIVTGTAALTAGGTASIASNLVGPTGISIARLDALSSPRGQATTGQRAGTNEQQMETARKAVASGMLASFVALLIGAAAAFAAGDMARRNATPEGLRPSVRP
jgi:hypothetical protein